MKQLILCSALLLHGAAAYAQAAAPAPTEAETLARQVVTVTTGDRTAVIAGLATPMVGMLKKMGVTQGDRAATLVHEVFLPVMTEHYDELLAIQARSYATVLSVPDMKAILAFYATPAGQDMARARPRLAQANMTGVVEWMGVVKPELTARLQESMKAHGWQKG